jgi:hypothetical protein
LLAAALIVGVIAPAFAQSTVPPNNPNPPPVIARTHPITPLGWYVIARLPVRRSRR